MMEEGRVERPPEPPAADPGSAVRRTFGFMSFFCYWNKTPLDSGIFGPGFWVHGSRTGNDSDLVLLLFITEVFRF